MRRQRGIALVVALLAVALAMLLVLSLLDRGELTLARSRNAWRAEQAGQLMDGLELAVQRRLLLDQRDTGAVDSLGEEWARPIVSTGLPGAVVQARVTDLGGCFNVNALAPDGVTDPQAVQRFVRLLNALHLPRELAAQAADFVDADEMAQPGGGEDAAYAVWPSMGRAANAPIVDIGALQRLPAMSGEAWRTLAPYLCATAPDQPINLNTAPALLWLTLDDAISLPMAQQLARGTDAAYPDLLAVRTALKRQGLPPIGLTGYGVGSSYFRIEADIALDGIDFSYTSVLRRLPREVRVIARTRGRSRP